MITERRIARLFKDLKTRMHGFILLSKRDTEEIAHKIVMECTTYTGSHCLEFDMQLRKKDQKTDRYYVFDKSSMLHVGTIEWKGEAKCYCFCPKPDFFFDYTKMDDITTFIHHKMREWRLNKKS